MNGTRSGYVEPPRWRPVLLTFLLLILALAPISPLVRTIQKRTRGIVFGIPPRIPHTDVRPYAVNADLVFLDEKTLSRALDLLREGGFGWIRVRFPWFEIEKVRGHYRWEPWDRVVRAARARGLNIIALVDGTPPWQRPPGEEDNPVTPPKDVEAFARFAAQVATRYGRSIDYYQVWDQPNVTPFWGNTRVDPAGYVRMLRLVSQAIHDADGTAFVLSAGLAPTTLHKPFNMSDVDYLEAMYAAGARGTFDILGAKAYELEGGDPWSRDYTPDRLGVSRLVLLREVMERHGDAERPIWVVGWGRHATPPDWHGRPSIWGTVSEEDQAQYVVEVFRRKRQEWPWLGLLTWDQFYPRVPQDDPLWGFALVRPDWTPRPVFWAFTELTHGPPLVGIGRYGPGAWIWRSPDAQLRHTIRAEGTSIGVIATQLVALEASLDGEERSVLLDARRVHFLGKRLPLRPHTLVLRFDPPGVTTLLVARDRPWGPYLMLGGLALVALLALGRLTLWAFWPPLTDGVVPGLLFVLSLFFMVAPTLSLSLLTLALMAFFVFYHLDWGIAAVLASLPFVAVPKRLGPVQFSLVEIYLVLTFLSWAGWMFRYALQGEGGPNALSRVRERLYVLWRPWGFLDVWVWVWVPIGVWAAWRAHYHQVAWREVRWVVLEPVLFYWVLRTRWRARVRQDLRARTARARTWVQRLVHAHGYEEDVSRLWARWVNAFLWGSGLAVVVGVFLLLRRPESSYAEGVWRLRGLYGSPNNMALILGRALALAYALWLFLPCTRSDTGKRPACAVYPPPIPGISVRWGYGVLAAGLTVGMVLTFSRAALLIGMPALILYLGWHGGRRVRRYALMTLVALFAALIPLFSTERFRSLWQGKGTPALRVELWRAAVRMLRDHPLWGVGPDNFLYYFRSRYLPRPDYPEPTLSHPHNVVLHFWLAMGVPGVVWIGGAVVGFFRRLGVALVRGEGYPLYRAFLLGSGGMMVYGLAHGLVDQSFLLPDLMILFMFSLGIVTSVDERLRGLPGVFH